MVVGIDIFKKYFEEYADNYVIIGGTACDIVINEAGFIPRATKDIDMILVVEALNTSFIDQFWRFIKAGEYAATEKSSDKRQYYRFKNPKHTNFPFQIEIFARKPDVIILPDDAHLTPIPSDDDLSSLSAILLSEEYYNFIIEHSQFQDGLHLANVEALICLKIIAYLEIKERIENGVKVDSRQMKKHKYDVFRLVLLLTPESQFLLPPNIQKNVNRFANSIHLDLPDGSIFKEMGVGQVDAKMVYSQLVKSFNIVNQN